MLISCIVAVGKGNGISIEGNKLPWDILGDLRHFKDITKKKVVIMGRKTFFSIPEDKRPLKDRLNIIITNKKHLYNTEYIQNNNVLFCSYSECVDHINSSSYLSQYSTECVVIGGEDIYNQFKNMISKIYLTEVIHSEKIEYTKHFFKIPSAFKLMQHSSIHEESEYK